MTVTLDSFNSIITLNCALQLVTVSFTLGLSVLCVAGRRTPASHNIHW